MGLRFQGEIGLRVRAGDDHGHVGRRRHLGDHRSRRRKQGRAEHGGAAEGTANGHERERHSEIRGKQNAKPRFPKRMLLHQLVGIVVSGVSAAVRFHGGNR